MVGSSPYGVDPPPAGGTLRPSEGGGRPGGWDRPVRGRSPARDHRGAAIHADRTRIQGDRWGPALVSGRQRVSSGSPYEATIGFSRAVRLGNRVVVSGTAPVFPDGSCPDDAALQARRCLAIITSALAEAGATPADVLRTRTFLTDRDDAEAVGRVHGEVFGAARPAATRVVVAALLDPRWRVEIEAEAMVGPDGGGPSR